MASTKYTYRMAYESEWQDAMGLAWRVFIEFDAPDYTKQGVQSFWEFVNDDALERMFRCGGYQVFLALDGDKKIGILTLRDTSHISLLFVDGAYQRQGVGSALLDTAREYLLSETGAEHLTVFAAPYGMKFYQNRGFTVLSEEKETDGIRYTPMVFYL